MRANFQINWKEKQNNHTVGTVLTFKRKVVQTDAKCIPRRHKKHHDRLLTRLGTDTWPFTYQTWYWHMTVHLPNLVLTHDRLLTKLGTDTWPFTYQTWYWHMTVYLPDLVLTHDRSLTRLGTDIWFKKWWCYNSFMSTNRPLYLIMWRLSI